MMNDKLTDGHKDGGLPASEWAGGSGERWLANLDGLERMIEPIGTALLTQAGYRPGEGDRHRLRRRVDEPADRAGSRPRWRGDGS
jgi:hypothetical protein